MSRSRRPRVVWSLSGRLGRYAPAMGDRGAASLTLLARRVGLDQRHELSLLLCDGATIRRINRRWRGHDEVTDVLSFPQFDGDPFSSGAGGIVGDIVVALPVARKAARAAGVGAEDHLVRLLAHGLLHLLGYDHDTPPRRRRMQRAEDDLLAAGKLHGLIRHAGHS